MSDVRKFIIDADEVVGLTHNEVERLFQAKFDKNVPQIQKKRCLFHPGNMSMVTC